MRPDSAILPIRLPSGGARIDLERKGLHRFLVAYAVTRGLLARPELRELLIAGVDVYPEGFPARVDALADHLDRVLGIPGSGSQARAGGAAAGL